jgi:hypothetical protein
MVSIIVFLLTLFFVAYIEKKRIDKEEEIREIRRKIRMDIDDDYFSKMERMEARITKSILQSISKK